MMHRAYPTPRPRFGRWQAQQGVLARLGVWGRLYASLVGYTQVGGYGRSLLVIRVLDVLPPDPRTILDAGCGTGDFALYLAERYPHAAVVAADADSDAIQTLQRTRATSGLHNLEPIVRRHEDTPPGDYDLVVCIDALQYVPDKAAVLGRFAAALAPGGALVLRLPRPVQHRVFPTRWFAGHEAEEGWRLDAAIVPYDRAELQHDLAALGLRIDVLQYTTGWWGRLAFETSYLLAVHSRLAFAFAVPALKLCAWMDTLGGPKRDGDGLLALGVKATPTRTVPDQP
jgi:SAM-dependent methyltransferase